MATSNQSSQKKKKYARLRILGVFLFVLSILAAPLNLIVGAVLGFSGIWMTTYYRTFMEESQGHTPTPLFKRIIPVLGITMLALWIWAGSTVTSNPSSNADVSSATIENSSSEQKAEQKADDATKAKQEAEKKAAADAAKAKQEAEKKAAADAAKAKQEAEKKAAADAAKAKQEAEKKAAADAAKAKQEAEKKAAADAAKAKQEAEKKAAADAASAPAPNPDGRTIYITPTGKRYHYDSKCNGGTYIESTLAEAKERGLTPCNKCVA